MPDPTTATDDLANNLRTLEHLGVGVPAHTAEGLRLQAIIEALHAYAEVPVLEGHPLDQIVDALEQLDVAEGDYVAWDAALSGIDGTFNRLLLEWSEAALQSINRSRLQLVTPPAEQQSLLLPDGTPT